MKGSGKAKIAHDRDKPEVKAFKRLMLGYLIPRVEVEIIRFMQEHIRLYHCLDDFDVDIKVRRRVL